jgi:tRNA-dihydrouridine synthase
MSSSLFCDFPLYLAPTAGVSDKIFRQLCKERGADVLVTEFVSLRACFGETTGRASISISMNASG